MDKASAAIRVDAGLILGRVKPKTPGQGNLVNKSVIAIDSLLHCNVLEVPPTSVRAPPWSRGISPPH